MQDAAEYEFEIMVTHNLLPYYKNVEQNSTQNKYKWTRSLSVDLQPHSE